LMKENFLKTLVNMIS